MHWKVAPFLGQIKERKKYFLNCLNSSQSTHNKPPHQLFNIFPSSGFPFCFTFFKFCFIGHSIWRIAGMLDPARTKIENAGASAWNFTLFQLKRTISCDVSLEAKICRIIFSSFL